jgi:hypothetical protein
MGVGPVSVFGELSDGDDVVLLPSKEASVIDRCNATSRAWEGAAVAPVSFRATIGRGASSKKIRKKVKNLERMVGLVHFVGESFGRGRWVIRRAWIRRTVLGADYNRLVALDQFELNAHILLSSRRRRGARAVTNSG